MIQSPEEISHEPKITVEVIVFDPDGKPVQVVKQPLRSFVHNWTVLLSSMLSNVASAFTTTSGGAISSGSNNAFSLYCGSPIANDLYGIVVGTGTTPVTINDYKLQTQISHGKTSGALLHKSVIVDPAILVYPSGTQPAYDKRVNAGGTQYTDVSSNIWLADQVYASGGFGYVAGTTFSTTDPIGNTNDDPLYQSERFHTSTLEYKFDVVDGTYDITLLMAEIFFTSGGLRVFNIVINGTTVQSNYDPFVAAGGHDLATSLTFSGISIVGGLVTIQFVPVVSNPKVSAIRVLASGTIAAPIASRIVISRQFVNLSGGSITINEIGLYLTNDLAVDPASFMMVIRDIVSSVTIPNLRSVLVRYSIDLPIT